MIRSVREAAAGLFVATIAVISLSACGAQVHEMDDVAAVIDPSALDEAVLSSQLRGFDGDKPFSAAVAGDRSTIFVVTGEPCDGCETAVQTLMTSAFTEPQYSVIVIGFPVVPKAAADASVAAGATIFGVPEPDAIKSAFEVTSYPTFVVVTPDLNVGDIFVGADSAQRAIDAARGG